MDGTLEVEGGPHGPLGVVLVGNGGAEHRDELASDDHLDRAAVPDDPHGQPGHAPIEQGAQVLGVEGPSHPVEAHQTGDQHGCNPARLRIRAHPGPGFRGRRASLAAVRWILGDGRRSEAGILPKDGGLELLELRTGIEAEVLPQPVAKCREGPQRLHLSARSVQGDHRQLPEPFA